ncbi:copper homeostasis protein CutC [Ligilactobacillus salitolerans]|uniref:PF03932 family protein CutC n=1 Tax=Ligilactobacillus salitolerans TaxID=1808352 RepID=A0A401ISV6_9LACO|nr:copper homeostasis protein CutC [Ligilactobacillus salitolerans]GBG94608.1 copper homeostasis protein CutC [Ligilactobacillus salitolerans]
MLLKEACVENFTDIPAVIANGAARIELCDNLAVGGTTPSKGVIAEAAKYCHEKNIPLVVLIRPRKGNYVYSDTEIKIMEADIFEAQALGADGISFGALTNDGKLDYEVMEQLGAAAGGMQLVLHMAFDEMDLPEQKKAIDWAVSEGYERILTHGGPLSASLAETQDHLKELIEYAASRITILPGGGITADNCQEIAADLGVVQVHGSKIVPLKN